MDNLKPLMQGAKVNRATAKAAFITAKEEVVALKLQIMDCKKALKEDLDFPE